MKVPNVGEVVEAVVSLPESIVLLNRSIVSFAQTVASLDTLVARLDRLTESLEGPVTALAPRLEALVPLLDEDVLKNLPVVLDSVNRNAVPALEALGQTQAQVATIAGAMERLMGTMDEGFARLADLPGVGLVSRLRGDRPLPGSPGRPGPRVEEG
jgi:hypothetical protein